jgi:hypothetical protein
MKIQNDKLQVMFDKVSVDKNNLYDALIKMGPKHLKTKEMKDNWTKDNPTYCYCYCYVVSEMLYWYVTPIGTKSYSLKVPNDPGLHRFLKLIDDSIIDLTAEQFFNYEDVIYSNAKVTPFMQTGCKGPSKRSRILADLMGYKNVIREIM